MSDLLSIYKELQAKKWVDNTERILMHRFTL